MTMTTQPFRLRILTMAALLAGTALVAGCSKPPETTTTKSETTSTVTPAPVQSSTTTTTINRSTSSPAP